MLKVYTWTTPNGIKPLIMLEELGVPYETHWVDIGRGQQHEPSFLRINPNGKIPALLDDDVSIFESGAILVHLAEKTGRFLPSSGQARSDALSWLFFQVGGIGPMFGQLGHFLHAPEKIPYAIARYRGETERLYGVLDKRLAEVEYLAGEYGVADIATVGWAGAIPRFGIAAETFPHVSAWLERVGKRPAVQRARALKPTPDTKPVAI
ncbi:MAG: gst7 [Myxococcaceae bacterium]|nr:gst7 [Myxococcaceae bacterium]